MARAEFIRTDFWDDVEDLTPWATLLFLWSWTNTKCNMAGLYRVSVTSMLESKVPRPKIHDALRELEAVNNVFYEDGVMWVRKRLHFLSPRKDTNPQMAKAVARDVAQIAPSHPLRIALLEQYRHHGWLHDEFVSLFAQSALTERKGEGASRGPRGGPDVAVDVDGAVVPLRARDRQ